MDFVAPTVHEQNPAPLSRWNVPVFVGLHVSQVVQDFVHHPYECARLLVPRLADADDKRLLPAGKCIELAQGALKKAEVVGIEDHAEAVRIFDVDPHLCLEGRAKLHALLLS